MYALNRAQLIGHLTETPNVRQTPGGQTVGDLNVVTRSSFINSQGQPQEITAYHNVVVWRGLADISQRYLKKGSQVYVSGRIQTDEWTDQNTGQKRYKTRITADELIMLDSKNTLPALPAGSLVGGSLNQAEVIGNMTKDPELRQTTNGNNVCSFSVATNFSWKSRDGQQQEKTEFHNIVAWGALAESLNQSCKKGRKVYIQGRLQTRSWDTPDGNKRYTTEIIADKALALGVPDAQIGAPEGSAMAGTSAPAGQPAPGNPFGSQVNVSNVTPAPSAPAAPASTPNNAVTDVPKVNYESEVKPEDLPF